MSGSPDAAPTPAKTRRPDAPPQVGDRVRVVVEGPVFRNTGPVLEVGNIQSRFTVPSGTVGIPGGSVSVEVLTPPAPPDPETDSGDIVIDARGVLFERSTLGSSGWYPRRVDGPNLKVDYDHPARPLTLLVRAGKAVTS